MDESEIRKLITDTAQTTATAVNARYDSARRDLHASEGWITWKQLTPKLRRRAGVLLGVVLVVGVSLGVVFERLFFR